MLGAIASALKVKNFRKLLDAVGEEQLAVKLDLTLNRVKEMSEGVNLSDEMAYHIENTLGLSSGFIDQVNPTLSDSDINRLKTAPLEHRHEDPQDTRAAGATQAAPVSPADEATPSAPPLLQP